MIGDSKGCHDAALLKHGFEISVELVVQQLANCVTQQDRASRVQLVLSYVCHFHVHTGNMNPVAAQRVHARTH